MTVILWTIWVLGSLFIFFHDRRSFLGGAFIALGFIVLLFKLFWTLLNWLSYLGAIGFWSATLILFIGIPALIIAVIVLLIRNTLVMNTKEGRSMAGKLSAALGLNLIFVLSLLVFVSFNPLEIHQLIIKIAGYLLFSDLFLVLLFVSYLFYSMIYQLLPVKKKIDYIIILGAGLNGEELTPLLKSRVDKALQYQEKQEEAIKFVFSGGQGEDEVISEARAMGNYARRMGISEAQIIEEDKSRTTLENMKFSKIKIMNDYSGQGKPLILFSTSNYHVLRGAIYARKAKLKATGIGAPTSFYFLPSALIREYIALIVFYKIYLIAFLLFILVIMLMVG